MSKWTRKRLADGASLCLELGAGLLENGAETSRVEESMRLTGQALGTEVDAVVSPTSITVTFGQQEVITRVTRIKERVINLDKVARLNALSRDMHKARHDLQGFRARVAEVRESPGPYTRRQEFLAVAVSCGAFALVLGGGAGEVTMAVIAGLASRLALDSVGSEFPTFLSLFLAGFLSTTIGLSGQVLWGLHSEAVIVGSLLHRMPGLAIVSSVRDLMAGELLAGVVRSAEAALVTLGMVSGVLACLSLCMRLGVTSV